MREEGREEERARGHDLGRKGAYMTSFIHLL